MLGLLDFYGMDRQTEQIEFHSCFCDLDNIIP